MTGKKGNGSNGNGQDIDDSEYSDQIGYRVVREKDGSARLEAINPRRQAIFEAALVQLKQI